MHYELSVAARNELNNFLLLPGNNIKTSYESVGFTPPVDGATWLQFEYIEAETKIVSLDRKCTYYVGMVQIGIQFAPGKGIDKVRKLAQNLANFFYDGKMLINDAYIVEGAKVHPVQKEVGGWFYPVRFYVRIDKKGN